MPRETIPVRRIEERDAAWNARLSSFGGRAPQSAPPRRVDSTGRKRRPAGARRRKPKQPGDSDSDDCQFVSEEKFPGYFTLDSSCLSTDEDSNEPPATYNPPPKKSQFQEKRPINWSLSQNWFLALEPPPPYPEVCEDGYIPSWAIDPRPPVLPNPPPPPVAAVNVGSSRNLSDSDSDGPGGRKLKKQSLRDFLRKEARAKRREADAAKHILLGTVNLIDSD